MATFPKKFKQFSFIVSLWFLGLFTFNYRYLDNWWSSTTMTLDDVEPIITDNDIVHRTSETPKFCSALPLSNQPLSLFNQSGFWVYHNSENCSSISCNQNEYNFTTLSCPNTSANTTQTRNCIGITASDPILHAHAQYRKKECIINSYSDPEMVQCLSKHKSIAIIGDSTSWQQWKMVNSRIKNLFIDMREHGGASHIRKETKYKFQYTLWNDTTDPNIAFKFQFIGRTPKRNPTLTFLSEEYITEFAEKWQYFVQNNKKKDFYESNTTEFIANIHKTGKEMMIERLNGRKVETIIFNDIIHAVSFWQYYDKQTQVSVSFDWKQILKMVYENAIRFFFANAKYLKRVYFWSGYRPPPSCHRYKDRWEEFNAYAVEVVNAMGLDNVYYIDAGDIGRAYVKGASDRRYTDGKCHYKRIQYYTAFNALLTGLCE